MLAFIDNLFADTKDEIIVKFFKYIKNDDRSSFEKVSNKVTDISPYIIASYYILRHSNDSEFIQFISSKTTKNTTNKMSCEDVNNATNWLYDNRELIPDVYNEQYDFLVFLSPSLIPTESPPLIMISPLEMPPNHKFNKK